MAPSSRDPLPRAVVRDLLAVTRVLYRAEREASPDALQPARLAQLEDIGKRFRRALEMSEAPPDSMAHRAAWSWAEQATKALGAYVAEELSFPEVLRASASLLVGSAGPRPKRRPTH